jgi:hypothetical protein
LSGHEDGVGARSTVNTAVQAESGDKDKKRSEGGGGVRGGGGEGGGEGKEREDESQQRAVDGVAQPPPPPLAPKPVTSFTLRLKKAGDKVVVVDPALGQQQLQEPQQQQQRTLGDLAQNGNVNPDSYSNSDSQDTLQFHGDSYRELVNGVLWSRGLEEACPGEQDGAGAAEWRQRAAGMQVVGVEEGCGRMQNRLITFKDGTKACARSVY